MVKGKKRSIWFYIKYYKIIFFVLAAATMYPASKVLVRIICDTQKFRTNGGLNTLLNITVPILLYGLLLSWFISLYHRKKYYLFTGRKLSKDSSKFHRNYYELLEYFNDADLYKYDEDLLQDIPWQEAEGIILGKAKNGRLFNIPSGKDGKNYFIFGMPSTGKTAGPVICSALRWGALSPYNKNKPPKDKTTNGSVFCIDLKNDIWDATHEYRNIKCFNLMQPQNSAHFNPLSGIESLSIDERCNFIENIGFNIVEASADGDGQYFTDTAYDYWNGVALFLLHQDITTSFPDIIKAILSGNSIDWVKIVVESDCEEAKRRLQSKWGENEKNLSGGYSKLAQSARKYASETLFFLLGNDPQYEYISPQTMEDGYDCYVQLDQTDIKSYGSLLSLITQSFLTGFTKRELNPNAGRLPNGTLRPMLMLLDEFAQLKTLNHDAVSSAFMTLRSKNISIACALQSRSSIAHMFGNSENACKELIDCVTTFCFLSIQEVETREWASKLIGEKKVLKLSNSVNDGTNGKSNTGKSCQEAKEPIIAPADFGNLVDKQNGRDELVISSQGKYIIADKIYYFQK